MDKLFKLPSSKETVDLSKIVSVSEPKEDYKYIEPYLFRIVFVSNEGSADLLICNETHAQSQDDYGALMDAWEKFVQ